jgi:hypothetical protein
MPRQANRLETVKVKKPDRVADERKARVSGKKDWDDARKYPSDRPGPLGKRGRS